MTDCIIAMRSQTYAAKGKRLLEKNSISASIVGIDPTLTKNGCAYGIQIAGEHCIDAVRIFKQHRLAYGDILGKGGNPI